MYPQTYPLKRLPHPDICQAQPEKSDANAEDENAAFSEEGEEEESVVDDVLVEPGPAEAVPETEPETASLTLASLAQTAEVLLKQGGKGIGGGLEVAASFGFGEFSIWELGSDRTLANDLKRYTFRL